MCYACSCFRRALSASARPLQAVVDEDVDEIVGADAVAAATAGSPAKAKAYYVLCALSL